MIWQEMTTVGEALGNARASLREDSEHFARDAVLLLAHVLDKPSSYPHLHPDDVVPRVAMAAFESLIGRRKVGEPVAYLRGYQEFMGMRFRVDRRVLIPRPETEILVETAISLLAGNSTDAGPLIADICCGSGAIGLSLAAFIPDSRVTLTDLSPDALDVARENAAILGLSDRVQVCAGDLSAPLICQYDLVVSNPPYIPTEEMDSLPRDVRCFEPRLALDGGQKGLEVIKRLAAEVPRVLRIGGILLVEIGDGQGQSCQEIFRENAQWGESKVLPDLAGRQRVLQVRRE